MEPHTHQAHPLESRGTDPYLNTVWVCTVCNYIELRTVTGTRVVKRYGASVPHVAPDVPAGQHAHEHELESDPVATVEVERPRYLSPVDENAGEYEPDWTLLEPWLRSGII